MAATTAQAGPRRRSTELSPLARAPRVGLGEGGMDASGRSAGSPAYAGAPQRLLHATGTTHVRDLRTKSTTNVASPDPAAGRADEAFGVAGDAHYAAVRSLSPTVSPSASAGPSGSFESAAAGSGSGAGSGGGAGDEGRTSKVAPLNRLGSKKNSRKLWKKAIRKVMVVQTLKNAHERWVAEHGDEEYGGGIRANRNTRKAKRLEYTKEFGTAGGTIQKDKVLRRFNKQQSKRFLPGLSPRAGTPGLGGPRSPIKNAVLGGPSGRTSPELSGGRSKGAEAGGLGVVSPGSSRRIGLDEAVAVDAAVQSAKPRGRDGCCRSCNSKMWYWVEEAFTKPRGKAIGLCAFALVQVVAGAFLLSLTSEDVFGNTLEEFTLAESMWESWTYVADPGTHASEASWFRRAMSFCITVSGILLFAVVVGFVVDAIRSRLDELKRGKSSVVEKNHYLILGWTDKSFSLIRELCLAMESEGGGVIVVLSERDKEVLDGEISEQFSRAELCGTSVVCRTGSPLLVGDLNKVAASEARAIVILAEAGDIADKADAKVLRTVLGLMGLRSKINAHVVAELRDVDNEGLLQIIGKGMVETVVSHDVIGRLMLKCARQPGLADAYEMFLGFEGDEFYLKPWPKLSGIPFGDLSVFFPDAIPVGIKRINGKLLLNPARHVKMEDGDELLVLAEDDDSYAPVFPPALVDFSAPPSDWVHPVRGTEKILFANSRRDVDDLIDLLDTLVAPGSELHMMSEIPVEERVRRMEDGGLLAEALENITIVHHVGNPSFRRHLERLPLEEYTSVLVLADERLEHDSMHSDSSCLATLLLIRHIQESRLSESMGGTVAMERSPMMAGFNLLTSSGAPTPTAKTRSKQILRGELDADSRRTSPKGSRKMPLLKSASVRMRYGGSASLQSGAVALGPTASSRKYKPGLGTITDSPAARAKRARPPAAFVAQVDASAEDSKAKPDFGTRLLGSSAAEFTRPNRSAVAGETPKTEQKRPARRSRTDELVAKYLAGGSEDDETKERAPRRKRRRSQTILPEDLASLSAAAATGGSFSRSRADRERSPSAAKAAKPAGRGFSASIADRRSPTPHLAVEIPGSPLAHIQVPGQEEVVTAPLSLMACELLDIRTRNVVQENVAIAALSDYILSNAITSRVLAMIAERREVKQVLQELLGPEGQEVAVRTAAQYVRDGEELSFYEVALRAQVFHQILLGYKAAGSETIVTNPVDKMEPRQWSIKDSVVVMLENEDLGTDQLTTVA